MLLLNETSLIRASAPSSAALSALAQPKASAASIAPLCASCARSFKLFSSWPATTEDEIDYAIEKFSTVVTHLQGKGQAV
jgi:hypothetical protein